MPMALSSVSTQFEVYRKHTGIVSSLKFFFHLCITREQVEERVFPVQTVQVHDQAWYIWIGEKYNPRCIGKNNVYIMSAYKIECSYNLEPPWCIQDHHIGVHNKLLMQNTLKKKKNLCAQNQGFKDGLYVKMFITYCNDRYCTCLM